MTGTLCLISLEAFGVFRKAYMRSTHSNSSDLTPISPFTQESQDESLGKDRVGHELQTVPRTLFDAV
jgi:hypothetical protein